MKYIVNRTLLVVALLGVTTYSQANINAYSFDETTKDAPLHSEFKKGDFNPYWFQEKEDAKIVQSYAYEASIDAPLHSEFKKGDFNPYWFQEKKSSDASYKISLGVD